MEIDYVYSEDSEFDDDDDDHGEDQDDISKKYNNETNFNGMENQIFSCDTCDKDFFNQYKYNQHMSEHTTCNIDGCQFTAHQKLIEKHIQMQHSTGLYNKIRNVNTPEDIAKWIAERKKNYPTKKNIEKKCDKQELLVKSGARLQKKSRFPTKTAKLEVVRKRPSRIRTKRKKYNTNNSEQKTTSLINDKADWNGDIFPFKGTSTLFNNDYATTQQDEKFEDDEWENDNRIETKPQEAKINNALGSLMAAYGSDSEDNENDEENITDKVELRTTQNTINKINNNSISDNDDDPPDEVKNIKIQANNENLTSNLGTSESTNHIQIPRKNQKSKTYKSSNHIHNTTNQKNKRQFPQNEFKKRKATLLEKLLEQEIQNERNLLLRCIRYVVKNNFFDN